MYLDAHYAEPIDLGVLTKVLHVEKTKLCQSVKKRCGLTPMQLVTRLRLSKAQELLSTTGESVKTIAAAVGFQDANYFIKVFHKETGCTPVQFRQRGDRNMEEYQ